MASFPTAMRGTLGMVVARLNTTDPGVRAIGGVSIGRKRLPTEPIGTMVLTLTNVAVGSRYRIERQGDGSLATPTANAEGVAAASTVPITLDVYAGGSANNDLRVKVRRGSSATYYKPLETLVTISPLSQSIYIAQIPD